MVSDVNNDALTALMKATHLTAEGARIVLDRLEAQGMTIYKKKVAKNGRRPPTSVPMTEQLARQVRQYFYTHPDATQQEIANMFNVNIGRVNEVLS